jgi:putative DNA primase/helicase
MDPTSIQSEPPSTNRDEYVVAVGRVDERLRARPQWVVWRYVTRGGKPTKVPFNARSGTMADSTKPETWSTFDEALAAYQRSDVFEGIGYVFAADDRYCGIDLDDCIDTETGEIKTWGVRFIDLLASYAEISPSGTGVKVIVEASKPGPRCKTAFEDGEVEMYDHDRFFTITGNHLGSSPTDVRTAQAAVDAIYGEVFGKPKPTPPPKPPDPPPHAGDYPHDRYALTDDEIIEKASRSRSGAKFRDLWAGNWNGHFRSQSEADSSLVFSLAFYTKDARQLDTLFRRSGLMREKWDEKHGAKTYGEMTIDKALATVTAQYRPRRPSQKSAVVTEEDADDVLRDAAGMIALGEKDPETGRLVLSPKRTLPTAQAFVQEFHQHPQGRTLHSYAGTLMAWRGNRYVEIEEETLRQKIQPWLHDALRYQFNKQSGQMELVDFESNPGTIKSAVESLRAHAHLPVSVTPPSWLNGRTNGPDPRWLLPYPSGTLDLASGTIYVPTPALFNINSIDFAYEPNPEPPDRWIRFLEQLWGDDLESVQLLQEWMGYSLVADTSQQKMLLMVGPKRSGKGTIGRVMSRLVGSGNVVGPTTSSLAGTFGLQSLIGKSLAIVSDARFSGENIGVVVERLLCISGEDTLTVDRKFLGSVTMKLPTRFVFLTNELPRMNDASGALAGRFVILRLTRSFYGNEDVTLTHQLMEELPGILLWAIEGLKRLRQRGHFVQPQSVADAVQDLEDLASPVMAFVRDRCEVAPTHRAWVDDLYNAWKSWCEADGRMVVTNKQTFGRDLAAAVPGVVCRKHSIQGRFYQGIGLRAGGVP